MTPSRSRMMSFAWRVCGAGSEANWTISGLFGSCRQLRDVRDLIHRLGEAAEQRQPVRAYGRILRHHQDFVEEAVHARARGSERAERFGVFAAPDVIMHDGKELL